MSVFLTPDSNPGLEEAAAYIDWCERASLDPDEPHSELAWELLKDSIADEPSSRFDTMEEYRDYHDHEDYPD